MTLPENGASMCHDTRENERPDICEDCEMEPGSCNHDMEECEQAAAEAAAEDAFEARRDAYD